MAGSEVKYVGVDACKGGWFSVGLGDDSEYETKVFAEFSDLLGCYQDASLILVDIPIGLPFPGPDPRDCDTEARSVLGERSSSVFRVPIREVVQRVSEGETRAEVSELSRSRNSKGIGSQTFGITRKIAEVDEVMTLDNKRPSYVREAHPEVSFWALNRKTPLSHPKKKKGKVCTEGINERLKILKIEYTQSPKIYRSAKIKFFVKRNLVSEDDILDALALAITAKLGCQEENGWELKTLPEGKRVCDCKGLPMEMVYPEPRQSK